MGSAMLQRRDGRPAAVLGRHGNSQSDDSNGPRVKRYAIFFPQFHRVRVNDLAWGHGFTDWALVAVANAFDYWALRLAAFMI